LNARRVTNRSRLYGEIVDDNKKFREMIEYRTKNGSSYRFEFTFSLDLASAPLSSDSTMKAITILTEALLNWVKSTAIKSVRLVKADVFPKCILEIHEWLIRSIQPSLDKVLHSGAQQFLDYASFEFIALVERLIIVNINGNMDRNFTTDTSRILGIVNNVLRYNWPYLNADYYDSEFQCITYGEEVSPSSMLLFGFMPSKYRVIALWNINTLLRLGRLILHIGPSIELNDYVLVFSTMLKNFFGEYGLFCVEKLQEKARKAGVSTAYQAIIQNLSSNFSTPTSYENFFTIVRNYISGNELYISQNSATKESLWKDLIETGIYYPLTVKES
jgi:hypothetical protein